MESFQAINKFNRKILYFSIVPPSFVVVYLNNCSGVEIVSAIGPSEKLSPIENLISSSILAVEGAEEGGVIRLAARRSNPDFVHQDRFHLLACLTRIIEEKLGRFMNLPLFEYYGLNRK